MVKILRFKKKFFWPSSRIVGNGELWQKGIFSLNLSAKSVMRGRLDQEGRGRL